MKLCSLIQSALAIATVAQAAFIAPGFTKRQATVDATAVSSNATRAAEEAAKAKAAAELLASMPTCGVSILR